MNLARTNDAMTTNSHGCRFKAVAKERETKNPLPSKQQPSRDRETPLEDLPGKGGTPDWRNVPSRDDDSGLRKSDLPGKGGTTDW